MLVGIDISHHNGKNILDTLMVRNEVPLDFVIAKATEGVTFIDNMFDYNMLKADKFGLLRGAYHYVNAPKTLTSGEFMGSEGEAYNFVSTVRPYGDTLLALDFEEKKMLTQQGVDYLVNVAQFVKSMTNTPPLIYASESVVKQFDFSGCVEIGCGLWVAKWKNDKPEISDGIQPNEYNPAKSEEFGITAIQQIASSATIKGVKYNIDVDIAHMSVDAWRKYANPRL